MDHEGALILRTVQFAVWSGLVLLLAVACTAERVQFIVPTPTPKATRTPIPIPTPTFSQLKEQATSVSYDDLFRYNEDYIGQLVYYRGQIAQVQERSGIMLLRVNVTQNQFSWEDDIRVDYRGQRLLEDDIVEFVGQVKGLWTSTAVLGNERTIPHVVARQLQLVAKAGES